jgi:hypothetical protein
VPNVAVDSARLRLNEDEVGVSTSSWECSIGREQIDSEGGGKNAGAVDSTLRITRDSGSGIRGMGGGGGE